MKIAVTYESGQVFQHFGHTKQFKVFDVENGKVKNGEVVDTNGSGHGALAQFLNSLEVGILVCGGIGGGAQNALSNYGIKIYGGVSGNVDEVIEKLLNGRLDYNPNIKCNHHSEGHNCHSHEDDTCHSDGKCGGNCKH